MDLLAQTLRLLREHGIRPSRRLGQSFLVDGALADRMVGYLDPRPADTVLEIGAGLGALTERLAGRCSRVIAVEVDGRLAAILRERFSGTNVEVVEGDILEMELPRVDKVISNVPYPISSELVLKLLREPRYGVAVLTFQREFAARLVARPGTGDYGRITVITSLYAEVELLEVVGRRSFYPVPKVDSAVVGLRPRPLVGYDLFGRVERITALMFSMRRKRAAKVLRRLGMATPPWLGDRRVYELGPEDFARLALELA